MNAAPDLEPVFPLPGRGDQVQVAVTTPAAAAPVLLAPGPEPQWCRVVSVDPGEFYPVMVRVPSSGRLGCYQQHEIRGWKPAWWRRLLWPGR